MALATGWLLAQSIMFLLAVIVTAALLGAAGLVLQHRLHMPVEAAQVLLEAPQHKAVVGT